MSSIFEIDEAQFFYSFGNNRVHDVEIPRSFEAGFANSEKNEVEDPCLITRSVAVPVISSSRR